MARLRPPDYLRLALAVVLVAGLRPAAALDGGKSEAAVLLAFRDTLRTSDGSPPEKLRGWGTPGPCRGNTTLWYGVTCHVNGSVHGVHLRGLGLSGAAPDLDPLAVLPTLRVINLADNELTGEFPDVSSLVKLKVLSLSQNRLTGVIPDDAFANLRGLRKLRLGSNDFWGPVPSSISSPRLLELTLENNHFDGPLPDFAQKELRLVNFANNNLAGPIPVGLSRFSAAAFQGNRFLCGKPLDVTCESLAPPSVTSAILIVAIVLIAIGVLLAVVGIATGVIGRRRRWWFRRTKRSAGLGSGDQTPSHPTLHTAPAVNISQGSSAGATKRGARRDEHGRLVFIQESRTRFEIEDLLRASAEVLGAGTFGSSYKATLLIEGPPMVVKRFKDMNGVGREDFSEHMRRLGRLTHPNLLPLVAYLYKKEEKLLITEHMTNGSLALLLHGNRGSFLDWGKRLRIIKGTALALAYLYDELPMLTVPHGHLKSANVLINGDFEAVLSDYALVPVLTPAYAAKVMVAYMAPECVAAHGKPSKKSDVWSLGILILEVLTGKFPANYLRQGSDDIAGWVSSVVAEERTAESFDKDMANASKACEGEMLKLLEVALACCEADVERRWDIKTAVTRIEEIKEPLSRDSSSLTNEGQERS